ncbi:hypothetical protein NGUA15_04506 [Salmonella enterica]|nr:hypothetical protein NGUA05_03537 [Salmonella enterica]GAR62691.1 hypothetical protein NGUA15_04506 [Salmonella enterica]GAS41007.1 hypothetical protein NGUA33_01483 [Salmonella enterica]
MPAIKKLADARDVILHELILHELIGHLSCAVVTVKSVQANNVNHVCTKTEKALYTLCWKKCLQWQVNE